MRSLKKELSSPLQSQRPIKKHLPQYRLATATPNLCPHATKYQPPPPTLHASTISVFEKKTLIDYGGTSPRFCMFYRGKEEQTSLVEHTKLRRCTSVLHFTQFEKGEEEKRRIILLYGTKTSTKPINFE